MSDPAPELPAGLSYEQEYWVNELEKEDRLTIEILNHYLQLSERTVKQVQVLEENLRDIAQRADIALPAE